MERRGSFPAKLHSLNQVVARLATKCTVILEQSGILKHKVTAEELDAAELRSKELTADYLESRIDLPTFRSELDKLPKLDLRQLAQDLHYKG